MVSTRAYGFLGTTIAVTSDQPAALDWLDEFLTPAFDRLDEKACEFSVELRSDGATYEAVAATRPAGALPEVPVFALDQKVVRRPHWTAGGRMVIADDKFEALYVLAGRQIEILALRGSVRFRGGAMRVIREIAAARALTDVRRLQLHAAAFGVEAGAVLLAGPKGCGKTTFLAHIAGSARAGVLANDRSLLSFGKAGIEVRGIPTIVNVRPGTLDFMPELFRATAPVPAAAFLTLAEMAAASASIGTVDPVARPKMSPAQLAQALGVCLAPPAMLAAVAFPEHHAAPMGLTVDRLSPLAAARRLLASRYGLASGWAEPTVFERLTEEARPRGADEALIQRLAAEVPCYSVKLGAGAYAEASTAQRIVTALVGAGRHIGESG